MTAFFIDRLRAAYKGGFASEEEGRQEYMRLQHARRHELLRELTPSDQQGLQESFNEMSRQSSWIAVVDCIYLAADGLYVALPCALIYRAMLSVVAATSAVLATHWRRQASSTFSLDIDIPISGCGCC